MAEVKQETGWRTRLAVTNRELVPRWGSEVGQQAGQALEDAIDGADGMCVRAVEVDVAVELWE
jgi:hypothetical protein